MLTVSVGVATASASSSGIEAIIRDADQALYGAKHNGRNQVAVARPRNEVLARAAE